jgi:phosphoenolpyruvate carboxylase
VRELDTLGRRNLAVFEAIVQGRHRYGPEAIGYFIVSGASGADDVLAALLLARWASAYDKHSGEVALDIAPQFESAAALSECGATLQQLLADPLYRRHLDARGRRQCVLIGYSDSNKEVGTCASRFIIHQAQRDLAQVLAAAGEQAVIFHARGGSIARGGGRLDALVRAAPAGAIDGVLRIREQGATVKQGYGLRPIAMRTLERAFNALSLTTAARRRGELQADAAEHLEIAALLAAESRAAYRRLVYEQPQFYDYFLAVTPIDVIERMQIGSRSVHRARAAAFEGLLPVPWVFAWSQSRYMLPGWYGAGAALAAAVSRFGLARLRSACGAWFFLRNLIDDIETMLARADLDIARYYDVLVPAPLRRFSLEIRTEFELACQQILAIKDNRALLDSDTTLQRSIALRNPYVDPMNLMQVDLLQRWRGGGRGDRELFEALLASVNGIAQGLQSTG